ncbi:TetR/AcrR family transcriptional regulator [Agrococcus jejuensis]|uniref:DNA-binding transcriptional regulator, AcrR family n=1 Tax=Agrococcus jejuensis TaxID=399736 RepID=A0A1G8EDU0_9MICO|nr:TetR/AcrR family transcriptional regulator [Agrococcus jejuensis]SDH68073.1 DNA-binding transcriptional regulator, AcrR family [Agrococcus jejuensis]
MARPNRSREKVLDAAAALAAEHGVTATTVDDIAERAGVAKGSVYYSFPSKDAVFEAVLADAVERTGTRLGEALEAAPAGGALRAIVTAFLQGVEDRPTAAKVVAGELFRTDRPWQQSLAAYRSALFALVADAMEADGAPRPSTLRASAVVGAMVMVAFERTVFEPDASIADAVEAVLAGA